MLLRCTLPLAPDIGASVHGREEFIIDFASTLAPVANGKVDQMGDTPEFAKKHSSPLLSAVAGGQWPEARKGAVPKWQIADDRCQHEAAGTLEHRRECTSSNPRMVDPTA